MWEKVKSFCLHSTTIAWSYVLALVGFAFQFLDMYGDAINDSTVKETIHSWIGDGPIFGRILLVISIINVLARLRTLRRVV